MALKADRIGTDRSQQPIGLIAESNILRVGVSEGYEGWNLEPSFQRGAVWTLAQKRRWIESILMGIGLPAIFVNRFPGHVCPHPKYGWQEIVIDGQQRLRATAEFMQDKFRVRGELWSEQSLPFRRSFRMHDGMTNVVYCGYETEAECAELYLKLLRAGTAHTPEEIKKAQQFIRAEKKRAKK
jgi:hypothetical protein